MMDPHDLGRISPDEQADALRTLIALFATSVVRGGNRPRNAISVEILDIIDEVPPHQAEPVAQLFSMLALRLRRRGRPRHTALRLALETALLTNSYAGGRPVESEADYLMAAAPDLDMIDDACDLMEYGLEGEAATAVPARLTAETIAAALIAADRERPLADRDADSRDLAVAAFMLRAAAQYLALTADRPPSSSGAG
jgi:hypothetical protein